MEWRLWLIRRLGMAACSIDGAGAGDHLLRAALGSGQQRYASQIRLVVADVLTLANPLVYPNPATVPRVLPDQVGWA